MTLKKTKLLTTSLLLASLTACSTPTAPLPNTPTNPPNNDTLTDTDLIAIAKQDNLPSESQPDTAIIGVHNDVEVIENFICSDVCPDNTLHIVHYDIDDKAQCTKAGGVTKSILTPVAIAVTPIDYCIPAVIADYWETYP